jgi:membrane dipeptidase
VTPSQTRGAQAIADAHNDLLVEVEHFRDEPNPFRDRWLDQLRRGGVRLQVCPASVDVRELPELGLRRALTQIAELYRAARDDPGELAVVRDAEALDEALAAGRIALLLSLEGAEPLGYDPGLIEVFWQLGVRMVSLTWNRRNPFADGLNEVNDGGLSDLGRELVDRLADLGVVLDLAHASPRTFFEVLERVPDAPVVVSHACCRAVFDTPRNLSDDQLRALAEHGGVLAVMGIPLGVDLAAPSLARLADHVDHAVEVMGAAHVGIGADFMAQIVESGAEPAVQASSLMPDGASFGDAVPGFRGPLDYPALVDVLQSRGHRGGELEGILSANLLRVIRGGLSPGHVAG